MRTLAIFVIIFTIIWSFLLYHFYNENKCRVNFEKRVPIENMKDKCLDFYYWKFVKEWLNIKNKELEKRLKLRLLYDEKLYLKETYE